MEAAHDLAHRRPSWRCCGYRRDRKGDQNNFASGVYPAVQQILSTARQDPALLRARSRTRRAPPGMTCRRGSAWPQWERIAVSNHGVGWVGHTVNALRFLIPGDIRVFATIRAQEGRDWIAAGSGSHACASAAGRRRSSPLESTGHSLVEDPAMSRCPPRDRRRRRGGRRACRLRPCRDQPRRGRSAAGPVAACDACIRVVGPTRHQARPRWPDGRAHRHRCRRRF